MTPEDVQADRAAMVPVAALHAANRAARVALDDNDALRAELEAMTARRQMAAEGNVIYERKIAEQWETIDTLRAERDATVKLLRRYFDQPGGCYWNVAAFLASLDSSTSPKGAEQ